MGADICAEVVKVSNWRFYKRWLLPLALACSSQAVWATNSIVTISISDKGLMFVAADLTLDPSSAMPSDLMVFGLPFQVPPSSTVKVPSDVYISRISSGANFTIFVLACPQNVRQVHVAIEEGIPISETLDGKGKVELDLAFSFASQFEKSLIGSSLLAHTVYRIVLPRKYDDADISVSKGLASTGDRSFETPAELALSMNQTVWVSFPNPAQRSLNYAKIVFSVLLGLFALALQIQPLRDRRFRWFVFVFILSSFTVLIAGYFSLRLAKGLDFLVFSAAAIPTALYAMGACIYLILAKKFQATIGGQVNLNGAPGQFVRVTLVRIDNGGSSTSAAQREALMAGGRYVFHVRRKKSDRAFRVTAEFEGITASSKEIQVIAGKATEVPVLDISATVVSSPVS